MFSCRSLMILTLYRNRFPIFTYRASVPRKSPFAVRLSGVARSTQITRSQVWPSLPISWHRSTWCFGCDGAIIWRLTATNRKFFSMRRSWRKVVVASPGSSLTRQSDPLLLSQTYSLWMFIPFACSEVTVSPSDPSFDSTISY